MMNLENYLIICGDYAHPFANSFLLYNLKREWKKIPTDLELRFAKDLRMILIVETVSTFGLQEILLDWD